MEFMQREMFVAVIEERSVQRAADRVSRTQPAVSIALRKLEGHVGTPLLDRSRRRDYRLTQAGELLYEFASGMIAMRNEVVSTLRGEATACTGRLSFESRWCPTNRKSCSLTWWIARLTLHSGRPTRQECGLHGCTCPPMSYTRKEACVMFDRSKELNRGVDQASLSRRRGFAP